MGMVVLYCASIAFYNFFGLAGKKYFFFVKNIENFFFSVTKKLTAVHRTLVFFFLPCTYFQPFFFFFLESKIDASRTICVWVVDLILWYSTKGFVGEAWDKYSWIQVIGFVVLFLGTLIYNGVIKIPFSVYENNTKKVAEKSIQIEEEKNLLSSTDS